ncbi:MAG: OmpH family outer membrane protein [Saprospiraceae bacterium]
MNKLLFCLYLCVAAASVAQAQKFAYLNSSALLSELPEVKAADSELRAFQAQLSKKGQEMVKEYQEKVADLQRKQEQGLIARKDLEAQEAILLEKQKKIQDYEQQVYADLSKRREKLFQPIFDRVNEAVKAVAAELGFDYVFDANTSVLVYADESLDISKQVMARLQQK